MGAHTADLGLVEVVPKGTRTQPLTEARPVCDPHRPAGVSETMTIHIGPNDWFLFQHLGTDRETVYGPFTTDEAAWRYLFGRESTSAEREQHRQARWDVSQLDREPVDAS